MRLAKPQPKQAREQQRREDEDTWDSREGIQEDDYWGHKTENFPEDSNIYTDQNVLRDFLKALYFFKKIL